MSTADAIARTLQWVGENLPYVAPYMEVQKNPELKLLAALATKGYLEDLGDGLSLEMARSRRKQLISKWDDAEHDKFVEFCNDGGLPHRIRMKAAKQEGATWRMNTVRWIEENHPGLFSGGHSPAETAPQKLLAAMGSSDYLVAETAASLGKSLKEAKLDIELPALRGKVVETWSQERHTDLVEYLAYGDRRRCMNTRYLELKEGELTMEDEDGRVVSEPIFVRDSATKKVTRSSIAKKTAALSKREAEKGEAQEIEDAIMYANPIAGSW